LFITLTVLAFSTQPGLTQDTDATSCPTLVKQALESIGTNCGGLGRNTACYGFNKVGATFSEAVADDFFTRPSDQTGLSTVASLSTAPLDTQLNEWGVAVMSVQANIPDSLPGQSVRFILLGNSEIENAVPPPDAQPTPQPIIVKVLTGANVRSGPTLNANVIGSASAGMELVADGISEDGQWLRAALNTNLVGWISASLVSGDADFTTLPIVSGVSQTPMQAFRLKTGVAGLSCTDAPSLLMVQGPKNVKVQITANGVDVQLGSTLVLQTTDKNTFQIATIDGTGRVGNTVIPPGFMTEAPLDDNGDVNGRFGAVVPVPKTQLDQWQVLENIPLDTLTYGINVPNNVASIAPRPTPIPTTTTPINNTGKADCTNFKATSPLDGLAYGVNTFYWDAAPGATSYRLNVVGFGTIDSSTTNVTYDLFNAGQQFQMSWFVQALVNGQVACTTPTVTVPREALPPPFSASWQCGSNPGEVTVNYANVPPGSSSVAIEIYTLELHQDYPVPPRSASHTFTGLTNSGGRVIASGGQTIDLPHLSCEVPR
jgi:hypothetical protein